MARTCAPHFIKHAASPGHLDLVSPQHGQSLDDLCADVMPILAQSLTPMPAMAAGIASARLATASVAPITPGCIAAIAEPTGATASDSAIRIAKNMRKRCRVRILPKVTAS